MLAAALWYPEHLRWPIFPLHGIVKGKCTCSDPECKSPGKHPLTPHGCKDATLDSTIVRAWWTKWPFANIGLATGKQSGVDVLDADPRHYGNETLWTLEQQYGELPTTVMGISGSLGPHFYFQHVDGTKNSEGDIGEGLDLRTTGGYAVVPPSLHFSGRRYCWEGASHPSETPIAAYPEWLLTLARGRTNGNGRTATLAAPVPDKIPHGTQHHTLVSFGGSMRRRGADEEEIFAALWAMNTRRCEKPGSEKDIRKMARSLCNNYAPDLKANVSNASGNVGRPAAREPNVISLPEIVSAADLYAGNIVPLRELLEGVMWDGLSMLIARPKTGKSWLMLQIAIAIAGGPSVKGLTVLDHGPVLYGAFEEPAARTMGRLRKLAASGNWSKDLHFVYNLLPLMGGGAEQLAGLIETIRPRLTVLDTLTALIKGGGKRESDVFRSQYAEVSRIRKLAEDFHTAITAVHHTRKGVSDGAVEAVAGTGGIPAAVDTLWHLRRKPEGEATLEVIGREAEEKTLALQFGQEPFGWAVLGDDAAQLLNAERREVLELLREDGALSPAAIAAELGKARPAVRMMLKRMREDGQVQKQGKAYIPSHSVSYRVTEREKE
jgi:hypothetical protein